jgi:hypothetical protein
MAVTKNSKNWTAELNQTYLQRTELLVLCVNRNGLSNAVQLTKSTFGYPVRTVQRASTSIKRDFDVFGTLTPCYDHAFHLQNWFWVKLLSLASKNRVSLLQKYITWFVSFGPFGLNCINISHHFLLHTFYFWQNLSLTWELHRSISLFIVVCVIFLLLLWRYLGVLRTGWRRHFFRRNGAFCFLASQRPIYKAFPTSPLVQ